MTFDLEKFKAGQAALTRRGDKRYFVALVPEMHERFRLLVRPEKGMVIRFYDEQGRIGAGRSMDDMDSMYEEPPKPRQIDWSKIAGSDVPVKFWHDNVGFLRSFKTSDKFPFVNSFSSCGKEASLETGLWVFNDRGENPWPEGVIVEVRYRDNSASTGAPNVWTWEDSGGFSDIIASRAVGLAKGWTY